MERVNELIRAAAIFTPGKQIKLVWFDWRRRQYRIVETTYHWREQCGDALLLHFAVTDGEALYELIFSTKEQNWRLQGVEAGV